jgi:hypothetical protein
MTARQALISSLHLFFVFLFFGAGFFFISLAYLPDLRVYLADMILFHTEICTQIGVVLFGVSFLLLLGLYGLNRGKFIRFVMGRHLVEMKEKVVRETIEMFFKKRLSHLSLVDLDIARQSRFEMRVAVQPGLDSEKIEQLLMQAEKDLADLFLDRFGYRKSFVLSVDANRLGLS